jgi:2-polyprenyl-3-methyl-5-hydroxy-6-metoxy-1,4-benzoquinol methylase
MISRVDENRLSITTVPNAGVFCPNFSCVTRYPMELIEQIAAVKGAAWVCNEILRDEDDTFVRSILKYDILSYHAVEEFSGRRFLDFGCGAGASTSVLARMLPNASVVGVEYVESVVAIAEARKKAFGLENVEYYVSPTAKSLPEGIGEFEFILLTGVFEHLMPDERVDLFPKIWSLLKNGGTLFITSTPNKLFPIEIHTTGGLPFLNYLPAKLAHWYARKFSKRHMDKMSWEQLLRLGIRGGSIREIMGILKRHGWNPVLMEPTKMGVRDRLDLWYQGYGSYSRQGAKKAIYKTIRVVKSLTGLELPPYLSLAIRKGESVR